MEVGVELVDVDDTTDDELTTTCDVVVDVGVTEVADEEIEGLMDVVGVAAADVGDNDDEVATADSGDEDPGDEELAAALALIKAI